MEAGLLAGLIWFVVLAGSSLFLLGFAFWARKLGISPKELRDYREALGFKMPSLGDFLKGTHEPK